MPAKNSFKRDSGALQKVSTLVHGQYTRSQSKVENNFTASDKLFKRYTAMVTVLFVIGSISPIHAAESFSEGQYMNYAAYASTIESTMITDSEGYLTKVNPQTLASDRSRMSDSFVHTVKSGETLSGIANSYGLKTNTVLWENNLTSAHSIRTGQKLVIPPVDGVSHSVASGETVEKIATKYKVAAADITKQNNLEEDAVEKGDRIFIPGAAPLPVEVPIRTTPSRVGTPSRVVAVGAPVALTNSDAIPAGSKPFIFPTRGKITQGYHAGHYALDIADRSKPPIWAAGSGTVIKASSGTWGGGYGNHVIIDHGNGLQTLYAHMDYLDVSVGDVVTQGQVIGRMGNTGRVYGATGIHLHLEVRENGVKRPPTNYY